MSDFTNAFAPKSDQLNADDLLTGPITVTVTDVKVFPNATEQRVWVYYNGSPNPYKPCKTMGRVLMALWSETDKSKWIGHEMTLFRDPSVRFGKDIVGGIKVSHATGITKPTPVTVTVSRGIRKPYVVQPLIAKSKELPAYPVASFDKNLPVWRSNIESGNKTTGDIIDAISKRAVLSDSMIAEISAISIISQNIEEDDL